MDRTEIDAVVTDLLDAAEKLLAVVADCQAIAAKIQPPTDT